MLLDVCSPCCAGTKAALGKQCWCARVNGEATLTRTAVCWCCSASNARSMTLAVADVHFGVQ